jgi:hypothetical protein
MSKRTIEVFSAGCGCCDEAIQAVREASCESCDVHVLDMKDPAVAARAKQLGIHRVPAVVIDGKLADCCATGEVDVDALRSMGLGVA